MFSVWQWFDNGSREHVLQHVPAEEAVRCASNLTLSVGAQIGTTVRVIIVDALDCTNFEWEFGKGVVYPPELSNEATL